MKMLETGRMQVIKSALFFSNPRDKELLRVRLRLSPNTGLKSEARITVCADL